VAYYNNKTALNCTRKTFSKGTWVYTASFRVAVD